MMEEIRLECLKLAMSGAYGGREVETAAKFLRFVETGALPAAVEVKKPKKRN